MRRARFWITGSARCWCFASAMIPSELLVSAYASGWFPMAVESGELRWYSPDPRGIIPLEAFHVPTRLARVVRAGRFRIEIDRDFDAVIRACAEADRHDGDPGTWIDAEIIASYCALHRSGLAHSVEAWLDGRLAGGLYGVALGGAFFGESMFHRVTDASKVALVALVDRLRTRGYRLLDLQWVTPHLERFGAVEIPRRKYLRMLEEALAVKAEF
jgi:leucyl/phenylalanyl-tRNA---protein transferase